MQRDFLAAGGSDDEPVDSDVKDRGLIVVSNREPYQHTHRDGDGDGDVTVEQPTGGLTAGLDPVMQRVGDTWIAWGDGEADAEVVDAGDCVAVPPEDPSYDLRRVWLTEDQIRDYYYGFSNQVLWPICHSALTRVRCDPGFWDRYREVNERFADAAVEAADGESVIWFQDYHLALAPRMAAPRLPEGATVMGFWHVPWPGWDLFRACPHRRELLEGLLGTDVLGFHTPRYRTNFLDCVDAAVDDAVVDWNAGEVSYQGEVTRVAASPMGVPFDEVGTLVDAPAAEAFVASLERSHGIDDGTTLAVGVDRLDYSKGIVDRLLALEQLWDAYPRFRGSLTYVQNGSESRSRIPAYEAVQERVAELVDRLNDRFGTDDWQPVVYTTDRLSSEAMYGLYRRADLALVSPVRDGMNLVAQEYVAAQTDGDGVLVLSDQAGVHDAVGEHAVTITPSDTEGFADAIVTAAEMGEDERRRRMARLRRWVADHDIESWVTEIVGVALRDARVRDARSRRIPDGTPGT